jgi:hypothetical protein
MLYPISGLIGKKWYTVKAIMMKSVGTREHVSAAVKQKRRKYHASHDF